MRTLNNDWHYLFLPVSNSFRDIGLMTALNGSNDPKNWWLIKIDIIFEISDLFYPYALNFKSKIVVIRIS